MPRKIIDWESIEKQHRLGQKSMRTLAEEFSINVSSISRKSKKHHWIQDKSQEVRQRTNAALVAKESNTPTRDDIETAVQTNLKVITDHRKTIKSSKFLVSLLSSQLKDAAENRDEIIEDIQKETKGDKNNKRQNRMLKSISLPTHSGVLRDLSIVVKNLFPLERQAYNIDQSPTGSEDDPINVRHSMDNKGLTRALEPKRVGPLQIGEGE